MSNQKILIGSPVYQKPEILDRFLTSIKNQNHKTFSVDYMFVDDNIDISSKELLEKFSSENPNVYIVQGEQGEEYICDDETHHWNEALMLKVAGHKNKIIDFALAGDYDYLFLVDSDLVLQPNLLEFLKSLNKEIVSEIFWCSWQTGAPQFPNVWLYDEYAFVSKKTAQAFDAKQAEIESEKFLNMLKKPGLYEVGGLGACTLISRAALLQGVNFKPIKNLTIRGEDRFFCIRAAVLGIELFVDTHHSAYHIYRDEDLAGVDAYIQASKAENNFQRKYKMQNNKITLSMAVKNEEGRYLEQVLKSLCKHIDAAVIIDDGSTDKTVQICQDILQGIPLHIIENKKSMFANETNLRHKQWKETIKTEPDWVLCLDADELLEERFWLEKDELINNSLYDIYAFRIYDMWNETQYREDGYWNAHSIYRPFLVRYQPGFPYRFTDVPQHCERLPNNLHSHPSANISYKIKHLGWSTEKDRQEKKARYMELDPAAIYGIKEQYDSILAESPKLKEFIHAK